MKSKIFKNFILLTLLILSIPSLNMADEMGFELPVLPDDLFSKDVVPEPCPYNESIIPKRYMIFWNYTPATDGDFVIVVHPRQFFLRTSHDNPNPNKIYWLSSLSTEQYKAIIFFLEHYEGTVFSDKIVWNWGGYKVFNFTKSIQSYDSESSDGNNWSNMIDSIIRENISGVFAELNRVYPYWFR